MVTSERGTVSLDLEEAEIVRAALFTLEHFMQDVWSQSEVSAVSGFTVERFASLRAAIDEARRDSCGTE